MAETSLRGSRLGALSYESDRTTDLAPRHRVEYHCPQGHVFFMPFAEEAEVPAEWECRTCGATSLAVDGPEPAERKVKHVRSHWDMLLERRTEEDLEALLTERLELLRAGKLSAARPEPVAPRSSARRRTSR